MADRLQALLDSARSASRAARITWRDAIAEIGAPAIPLMVEWIADPELGAFAVRVLERIAEQPEHRRRVIEALEAIDESAITEPVAGDIEAALHRLRPTQRSDGVSRAASKEWSGYAKASALERQFHDDMLDIFRLAGEATRKQRSDGSYIRGYWASYFLRGVRNHGGPAYAHQLLLAQGTTAGFQRLTEENRLDLTMEALVLRPEYERLFSPAERQIAASRLARAGYEPR